MAGSKQLAEQIAKIPLFSNLEPRGCEDLARRARLEHVSSGKVVVRAGDRAATLYAVLRGNLTVRTAPAHSEPLLLHVLGPGSVFGELALLTGQPRSATIEAITDCELVALDERDFRHVARSHPEFALALLRNFAGRILELTESVHEFSAIGLAPRLAHRLCVLAREHGNREGDDVLLTLPLSQSDWAQFSGVTREAVNRRFRAWAKAGWIEIAEGDLRILRLDQLERLAATAALLDPA